MIFWVSQLRKLVLILCWLPLILVLADVLLGNLGSNPIQALHIRLGDWALRFLWITLAITPIQTMSKWRGMSDYRQLFGLFAFVYATLHLFVYLWVDHVFIWHMIFADIFESSYIWLGLIAYIIILMLAITSSKSAKKIMGKSWKKLHRFIYVAAITAILHYFWQLKGNMAEPLFYLIIVMMLLGFRLAIWFKTQAV